MRASSFLFRRPAVALTYEVRELGWKLFVENDTAYGEVRIYRNPSAVAMRTTKAKGALVMVATTRNVKVVKEGDKPLPNMISLGTSNLFISSDTNWNEPAFVSPFWHVESTTDKSKVNMELAFYESETQLDENLWPKTIHLPRLVNTKRLGIADRLYRLASDAPAEPPAKRQRRR